MQRKPRRPRACGKDPFIVYGGCSNNGLIFKLLTRNDLTKRNLWRRRDTPTGASIHINAGAQGLEHCMRDIVFRVKGTFCEGISDDP